MKKSYITLIVVWFIILFLPIAYYYWYALPKLERDKFEYQVNKDREAEQKKIREKEEAEEKEMQKKIDYEECKQSAINIYDIELEWVCEASYNWCKESVDSYNALWLTYYPKRDYWECEKHKFKDWWCMVITNFNNSREQRYKTALAECDKILKY